MKISKHDLLSKLYAQMVIGCLYEFCCLDKDFYRFLTDQK